MRWRESPGREDRIRGRRGSVDGRGRESGPEGELRRDDAETSWDGREGPW